MGQIYSKPTKDLMAEWANEHLKPRQVFGKPEVVLWFKKNYPDIKSNTVQMHVEGMSVNNRNRRHHPNIKPGSDHDLFFKEGRGRFRLWDAESDPPARYKADIEAQENAANSIDSKDEQEKQTDQFGDSTFAYEKDLQSYLVRNLHTLEPGLALYEDEGLNGIEFDAGGRYIDILATDSENALVVIELKVSKGYDRAIGQLLRYMGWVQQNMECAKPVRGMIVASEISDDLILATNGMSNVRLVEYEISFSLKVVKRT